MPVPPPTATAPPAGHAAPGPVVELDAAQRAVLEDAGPAPRLVLGAPGTGKTTTAVELVARRVGEGRVAPERALLLAATRRGAARVRDRLSQRLRATTGPAIVRTPASAAFAVLRARAVGLGEPPPALISGPEQDVLLAELLAGHLAGEGAPVDWPPSVPPAALGLRAFRDELRDLLMRAAERGLRPADLAELGRRHGRPEWTAAAALYEEYLDVTALRQSTPDLGARVDPAAVLDEAAEALADWDPEAGPAPSWDLVVVDDYQESTAATVRFLERLRAAGAELVLLADPDAAAQTFRGASPALVGRAEAAGRGLGEFGARRHVLTRAWRQPAALRAVTRAVADQIPVVGAAEHRRAGPGPDAELGTGTGTGTDTGTGMDMDTAMDTTTDTGAVRAAVLPSAAQEAAYVAHALRSAHLRDGLGWDRMAVIVRSGSLVAALRRSLPAAGVPVSVAGSAVPLRAEPAVRPLLTALRVAVGGPPDVEDVVALLMSPLGGLDSLGLRRLRRALRAEELAGGGGRASDALLVELFAAGEAPGADAAAPAQSLPAPLRTPVVRLLRVVQAGRAAAARSGADAQTLLWAVWHASGLADAWRRQALAGGPAGERADRDLDAVLALFGAAEQFVDRLPQAQALDFVDYVLGQELPADSLTGRAGGRDAVEVLTPAAAAGREWDLVVVAGLQDGVWPDLRLRDSMLGAQALTELLAGRSADASGTGPQARRAVLADELRAFVVAVSRARRRLLLTAVADLELEPSVLLDLACPPPDGAAAEGSDPRRTTAPEALDLRGVVAGLRRRLEASARGSAPDAEAAALLARLAAAGVPGADPAAWHGLAPLTSADPVWGPDARVPLSPSRVEGVLACPLRWALEAAGGRAADSRDQSLGTLVHAVAQAVPEGGLARLRAELDARWAELALPDGWPSLAQRRQAEQMMERLADYLAHAPAPLATEATFTLELGRAVVRGIADRIEPAGDGRVRVVDLKTGRRTSDGDARVNPQLATYQLAVQHGAFEELPPGTTTAGAALVYVGRGGKTFAERAQPPVPGPEDPESWARQLVEQAAETMASATFAACANKLCVTCPVRRSCPVQPEGRPVVA